MAFPGHVVSAMEMPASVKLELLAKAVIDHNVNLVPVVITIRIPVKVEFFKEPLAPGEGVADGSGERAGLQFGEGLATPGTPATFGEFGLPGVNRRVEGRDAAVFVQMLECLVPALDGQVQSEGSRE